MNTERESTVEEKWQELYIITKHWKSDIQFYKDDLKFLQHLINKYLIWITKKENLDKVMEIGKNLLITTKKCNQLGDAIDKHLVRLSDMMKNPFMHDSKKCEAQHIQLEHETAEFLKSFRKHKKIAFAITEYVIDNEKLVHYLETGMRVEIGASLLKKQTDTFSEIRSTYIYQLQIFVAFMLQETTDYGIP